MAYLEGWLSKNWFKLLQTAGIVLGLLFTGVSLRRDARSRRLSNLLTLKEEHRELWNIIHERPALARILRLREDGKRVLMTKQEEVFLRQMIVHFAVAWELFHEETPSDLDGLRADAAEVFSLPLPKLAWQRVRAAQNPKFARFVDDAVQGVAHEEKKPAISQIKAEGPISDEFPP